MSPSKNSRTSSTLPPASTLSSCFSSFSITSLIHFLWFHELRHIWTFWLCLQNTLILQWLWFPQCWDNLVPSSSTIARVTYGGKVGWIGNKSLSVSWKHKLASSFKLTIFSKKNYYLLAWSAAARRDNARTPIARIMARPRSQEGSCKFALVIFEWALRRKWAREEGRERRVGQALSWWLLSSTM